MTEFNPITTLNINDNEVEAKATFFFDKVAKKFEQENEDKDGKKVKTPGFNVIYNGILERDTDSIADFWECATAYLGKNAPSRDDIETALYSVIEEKQDTLELLQGALDVLNNSGFFKQKSRQFWAQMNTGLKMAKQDEKESTQAGIEFMKESYKEIMNKEPYLTTPK
ncbi:tail assembly chaperone [Staphylococcus agnetis]|uniref:tail assembly chaperone n=1 Tax=Staphylococcus agnetis TaxID=985762 RepID=UPI0021D1E3CE|nr:tail assembly chaperone [Staphylococcus agnetis]UXU67479.1 tail assembly chaperone [Staphylococcus agnetis]